MTSSEVPSLRSLLLVLLRVALGLVFLYAGAPKIADPEAFAASIADYKILSPSPAMAAATVLPWIEALCGACLLLGIWSRGSSLVTSGLLVIFTASVVSAMARKLDISCGCFTQDPLAQRIGWWKIAENVLLLGMSVAVFRSRVTVYSLDRALFRREEDKNKEARRTVPR